MKIAKIAVLGPNPTHRAVTTAITTLSVDQSLAKSHP
jgi:hypothetical protein